MKVFSMAIGAVFGRHLHRGQGHVLTLDEFKEGLSNTFGALVPLQVRITDMARCFY